MRDGSGRGFCGSHAASVNVGFLAVHRDVEPNRLDAAKGAALIETKGCLTCHRVNARGSIFAADLTDIGTLRSAEVLLRALTEPPAVVPAGRRFVRAVTKDGRAVSGRRLNEDTFTVQLLDEQGTLVSLVKSDLREYSVTRSFPLPAAKTTLTPAERADLAAYLTTLTTAPSRPVTR